MSKAERLFRLVLLLRRGRVVRAEDLARALEVSRRTIYRDVQALVLSGIPVEGEAGVGYVLRRNVDLPPLMFTVEEARALALGARMVAAWGDPALKTAASGLLEKVRAASPEDLQAGLDDSTMLVPGFHVAQEVRETLGVVRRAVVDRRKLRIHYSRLDGEESRRRVRPLGLVYWGPAWSLCAWCEWRRAFRNFRVDRMQEIRLLKQTFEPTEDISLEAYLRTVENE